MSVDSSAGLFSTFGSYDFFGKSIPGVLTVILIILSLPLKPVFDGLTKQRIPELAVLLILLILFGFVVGQGLHTVAVLIESILFSIGKRVLRCNREVGGPTSDWFNKQERLEHSDELSTRKIRRLCGGVFNFTIGVRRWIWPRYVGIKRVFKPHRAIFKNRVKKDSNHHSGNISSELFFEKFERIFDKKIAETENLDGVYSLVLSYINTAQANDRSGRFQASYTFCRSIWVIFLGFSLVYLIVYVNFFPNYETDSIVELYLPDDILVLYFSVSLFLSAFPFMYAAGAYKIYFVQYIFADFVNASISEEPPR